MFSNSKIGLLISLFGVIFFILCPYFVNSYLLDARIRARLKMKRMQNLKNSKNAATGAALGKNDGSHLLLSPFIEKGDYARAEKEAVVPPMLPGVESFAGFITVNKTCDSNIFFWMFKAFEGDWKKKPLIIWLQGGPGVSSMLGLFREIGPYYLDAQGKLKKRKHPWCQKYNLMFIDNPVGTGFSYTKQKLGYTKTETDVAEDLYNFIVQFYVMFPSLGQNPLYIMGESYAGKYVPAFAHYIHVRNKENKGKGFVVPLAAVAVGNGIPDPFNMLKYGDYLFQLGLVDRRVRDTINKLEEKARVQIRAGEFDKAKHSWDEILDAFFEASHLYSPYNYINDDVALEGSEDEFLDKPETRRALHVGNQPLVFISDDVYEYMNEDFMKSVKPLIEDILQWEAFRFVSYAGQLDIICAYPLSVNAYHQLKWKHADDYKKAKRCQYVIGDRVVGYFKTAGVFTEIMVRNSGHLVPVDIPEFTLNFLDRFVTNKAGFKCV